MTRSWVQRCEWAALAAALVGSAGSVGLSVGLGLKACPLCLYERTFMFSALGVLLMCRVAGDRVTTGLPSLLVLPLAIGGLGVALFHVWLELSGTLECPDGILGIGSAPQQSLTVFVLLTAAVLPGTVAGASRIALQALAAAALGVILTIGCIVSAPPLPEPKVRPSKADGYVLSGCEPAPAKVP